MKCLIRLDFTWGSSEIVGGWHPSRSGLGSRGSGFPAFCSKLVSSGWGCPLTTTLVPRVIVRGRLGDRYLANCDRRPSTPDRRFPQAPFGARTSGWTLAALRDQLGRAGPDPRR